MTKEDDYKIATIVCASVAGALLILLLLTWICCCVGYERRRKPRTTRTRVRTDRDVVQWDISPYAGWGQDVQQVVQSGGCQSCAAGAGSGGCRSCAAGAGYSANAYDWMAPGSGVLNTYNPTPVKSSGDYGKVLLNPPKAMCAKPTIPSAQLAGHCNPNAGTGCGTTAVNSSGFLTSPGGPSSGAQFVLESANRY